MHVLEDRTIASNSSLSLDVEALIREARRLRRRRWIVGLSVALAVTATMVGYAITSSGSDSSITSGHNRATAENRLRTAVLPTGPTVALNVAGSLAVGPTGVLYVAAPAEHRILARLRDGKFKVVAGTGISGYSGTGGRAIDAELSDPTDLTFNAMGNLYFVDSGRVRVVRANGVIETVAGDGSPSWAVGSHPVATVANGAPALSASFRSDPSIAFGPGDVLYIATDTQLLRMTNDGRLDTIPTHRISFGRVRGLPMSLNEGLNTLAVAKDGSIFVSGFNGEAIWHVATNGDATYVGYDRGSGGTVPELVSGPGRAVYSEDGGTIMRVTSRGLFSVAKLAVIGVQGFWPTNFAFGPHGTLFVDELPGSQGFESRQELISIREGSTKVLWTEPKSAAARHIS